ncbi:MAG: hypothetical protein P8Q18_09640 [Porticoccaceae bacterium]|nr:hypothetical protein [Porticoccaceae bacterium]MDG1447944.1 hypothetical protein [Porticoccaceae bacterium]
MAKKLPAAVLSLCLLLGLIVSLVMGSQTRQLAQAAIADKSYTALSQLDELIRTPLFNNDRISVQVALSRAVEDAAIFSASLYDVENQLISQSRQQDVSPDTAEIFRREIELQDTIIGSVIIELDSQPIYAEHRNILISWILLWLIFTGASTYGCLIFAEQLTRRLRILANRLPGGGDPIIDELTALEAKIQPLLSNSGQSGEDSSKGYYYSVVRGCIKNRQRLNNQLNRENLELLFEKIDYCAARTLELYGGQRVEGADGSICFYIRSTQNSKQQLLVCLMAVYSLQQLLERLTVRLGVDLEINWTLCGDNLTTLPLFRFDEGLAELKQQCAELGEQLQDGLIGLRSTEYDIEALSSIARFLVFDQDCFVLQGFPEGRQTLLEKQILHLASVCL